MKKLLLATLGSFAFLLVVNAALFPIFFPDGPPERYAGARARRHCFCIACSRF